MNHLKKIALFLYKKPTIVFFIFLVVISIDRGNRWKDWDEKMGPFTYDVKEYYAFLPHHTLKNPDTSLLRIIRKNNRSIGMSILYSPFFAAGHIAAKASGAPADGFSKPYQEAIHFGTLIYTFIALIVCRKILLKYFNEAVVCICLVIVVFATNLFYYSYMYGEMPHAYLFFLYSLFIFYSLRWVEQPKRTTLFIMACVLGFISLIRPTDALLILLPLLFGVNSLQTFTGRLKQLFAKPVDLVFAVILFLIPFCCQLIYWKTTQGKWLVETYRGERFYFNDPQIVNFLFSYCKGWLVYTPVMIFSLIGMLLSFRYRKDFALAVIVYFLATVYVLSSWWDWTFGGSFGCRALVQSYSLLMIPLCVCIDFVWNRFKGTLLKYGVRLLWIGMIAFFIKLNLVQSNQYNYSVISWNGMTKEAYWFVFMKKEISQADRDSLQKLIRMPDVPRMMAGDRDQ